MEEREKILHTHIVYMPSDRQRNIMTAGNGVLAVWASPSVALLYGPHRHLSVSYSLFRRV